jgi:hypothetical protein
MNDERGDSEFGSINIKDDLLVQEQLTARWSFGVWNLSKKWQNLLNLETIWVKKKKITIYIKNQGMKTADTYFQLVNLFTTDNSRHK